MEFRSVADLNRDVVDWADRLPDDVDVVVGVPRSGMLAASMLALRLHVPLGDLDGVLAGRLLGSGRRMSTGDGDPSDEDVLARARRILVVDDSLHSGASMREAQAKAEGHPLADKLLWGAVYSAWPGQTAPADLTHSVVAMPRAFEWNVMHHARLPDACMDIDGVLCRDPEADENDDGHAYAEFLQEVPARVVPGAEVGWLVTSRLERYREQTERWLAARGIRYRELLMHPAETAEQRRAEGSHARHKAEAYTRTGAWLFIESDVRQASAIAGLTGRPVYCTDASTMVYPGVAVGEPARRRDHVAWHVPVRLARFRRRVRRVLRRAVRRARAGRGTPVVV